MIKSVFCKTAAATAAADGDDDCNDRWQWPNSRHRLGVHAEMWTDDVGADPGTKTPWPM